MAALRFFKSGSFNKFNSFYLLSKHNISTALEPVSLVRNTVGLKGIKTQAEDKELIEQASIVDETEYLADEQPDLEWKRNKSRLYPQHRNILNNEVPYSEAKAWYHGTVKYKRKMYGQHGERSGVNPGIMWPTREELKEMKEFEGVRFSETLPEMIAKNALKKKEAEDIIKAREDDITKKIGKLEQWKKEVNTKIAKRLADAQSAKERKDRMVEEVRRHFGFNVDPREDRFKEMLEMKEKAEKKTIKEEKKKLKEEKMMKKLTEIKPENVGVVKE